MIFFITHIHWKEINWWNINRKMWWKVCLKNRIKNWTKNMFHKDPSGVFHKSPPLSTWSTSKSESECGLDATSLWFSTLPAFGAILRRRIINGTICGQIMLFPLLANRMRSSIFQHIIREWLGFVIGSMADEIDEERGTSPGNETQFPLPVCCLHNKTLPG